jgi:CubicO group peptidase (beta-lactamase class C family)
MLRLEELDRYLRQRAANNAFSGVALLTQGDTILFREAYGYASRTWHVPTQVTTRFDTASITKLFTAIAILQLIDHGHVAFDTGVNAVLGLTDTAISPHVTIQHLLTHTSGIADDADEEAGEEYAALWTTRPNYAIRETADQLPLFLTKPPNFPPGHGCRYCNDGYILLGLIIERVSGLSYRDYIRRSVFAAAGMTHSDFFQMDVVAPDVAEGCDPLRDDGGSVVGWKRNLYAFPPIGSPDAGAHVTAQDLHRFLRQVQRGALVSPQSTSAFFTPQVLHHRAESWQVFYGYGLEFAMTDAAQALFWEKDGINAGVSGAVRHYPGKDMTLVLLANTQEGVWQPRREIHRMLTAE